jgi:hypothetical protein
LAESAALAGQGELAAQDAQVGSVVRVVPAGQGALVAQVGPVGQEELAAPAGQAAAGKRPIVRPLVQRAALAAALVLQLGPRDGRT